MSHPTHYWRYPDYWPDYWPSPNFDNPPEGGTVYRWIGTILTAFTLVIIGLRLWVRCKILRHPGLDDYLIIVSAIISIALLFVVWFRRSYGGERHEWDIPVENNIPLAINSWVGIMLYLIGLCFTKLSILILYRRIFARTSGKLFQWLNISAMVFVILSTSAFVLVTIFTCVPVQALWLYFQVDPFYEGPATCVYELAVAMSISGINFLSDAIITVLPLLFLRGMKMPRRQIWAVRVVFGLGFFVCIMGPIRIYFDAQVFHPEFIDYTWNGSKGWLTILIEYNLAIICASAPPLRTFLDKFVGRTTWLTAYARSWRSGSKSSTSTKKSSSFPHSFSNGRKDEFSITKQLEELERGSNQLGVVGDEPYRPAWDTLSNASSDKIPLRKHTILKEVSVRLSRH